MDIHEDTMIFKELSAAKIKGPEDGFTSSLRLIQSQSGPILIRIVVDSVRLPANPFNDRRSHAQVLGKRMEEEVDMTKPRV